MRWVVVRFAGDISATRTPAHQSCRWLCLGRENHAWEQGEKPFPLCGFAVSLQCPLGAGLQLALAGKGKGSQGPALASQRQAARVDLELRDNKLEPER